ncbi:hypothetical protein AGLY_016274 [Aphis glycines]|uniref:Uncharacterized protein n=1 Tax=Aphis glycines TaxID=307491 RepID=A0A6G0SY75_APHGL|nr:hypothetical protein AGLY_016274 [Aphis glycines]
MEVQLKEIKTHLCHTQICYWWQFNNILLVETFSNKNILVIGRASLHVQTVQIFLEIFTSPSKNAFYFGKSIDPLTYLTTCISCGRHRRMTMPYVKLLSCKFGAKPMLNHMRIHIHQHHQTYLLLILLELNNLVLTSEWLIRFYNTCKSKISKFYIQCIVKQNIFRFNISMYNTLSMNMLQSFK